MRRCLRRIAVGALLIAIAVPATAAAATPYSAARSAAAWNDVAGTLAATRNGARPEIRPRRYRALTLDRRALARVLAGNAALTISLPAPDGSFRRFAVHQSSVMEPGLAAAHPDIATYSGSAIDDPGSTVHLDLTPIGLHASVRGPGGSWYIDPYYHRDQSAYASYRGADLVENPHGTLRESAPSGGRGWGGARPRIDGPLVALRTYRLALASDPAYAAYHGAANVTAAKVVLINRVNQIYEDDLAIHLTLVADNDVLNFDTDAEMTGTNGACGSGACFTASQVADCGSGTLLRTRAVLGQLIGASNFDIGHLALAGGGGGVASLGVVGDRDKAEGCTGIDTPVGDAYAVDFVAHEVGHQFGANHTFNGVNESCADNIEPTAAVEPGGGVTIMGYAGICGSDDLQVHSDPYFSQHSLTEVTGYVGGSPADVDEIQTVALRNFSGTDSFTLTYDGVDSGAITRGTNYSAAGIDAAIEAIPAFPASASVTVGSWGGAQPNPDDAGFSVTFGGTLANTDVAALALTSPDGVTGSVGETAQGGPSRNAGAVTATGNHAPVVEAPAGFTIPVRTPFHLTGSATDADGDALAYLWEQNDPGSGTGLVSNAKPSGPLFRVFGTRTSVTGADSLLSPSPGENAAGTDPTRVFPDLAQVVAGNTNAATGSCPAAGPAPVAPAIVDCYSEFLPTPAYANTLHFRLTARDAHAGAGGVGHDDTTLTLAKTAGPFRVISHKSPGVINAGEPIDVIWSVAGTAAAPVSAANVTISLSTDGGRSFPYVLPGSTLNDGSAARTLPNIPTTRARIRVAAVGNVFFDVNRANLTITSGTPKPVEPDSASFVGSPTQLRVTKTGRFTLRFNATSGRSGRTKLESVRAVRVRARAKKRKLKLASKPFDAAASGAVRLAFKLSARQLKALKRAKVLRFKITVTMGDARFVGYVKLKPPKKRKS